MNTLVNKGEKFHLLWLLDYSDQVSVLKTHRENNICVSDSINLTVEPNIGVSLIPDN